MCCVVIVVSGCRKEKNERHVAWLLIVLLVCRTLIHVCDCFSLVFVWHFSLLFVVGWSHLQLQHWCLDIRGLGHLHVVLSGGIGFY